MRIVFNSLWYGDPQGDQRRSVQASSGGLCGIGDAKSTINSLWDIVLNRITQSWIQVLFTIAKTWNQPKCPSMIDWTRKMWHIYTIEYYAAIKNNEFVSFVGTWINLETIILSKLTQEQKIKHRMFSLIGGCWTMRTRGHREGSITHWGLLVGGQRRDSKGWGGLG